MQNEATTESGCARRALNLAALVAFKTLLLVEVVLCDVVPVVLMLVVVEEDLFGALLVDFMAVDVVVGDLVVLSVVGVEDAVVVNDVVDSGDTVLFCSAAWLIVTVTVDTGYLEEQ